MSHTLNLLACLISNPIVECMLVGWLHHTRENLAKCRIIIQEAN